MKRSTLSFFALTPLFLLADAATNSFNERLTALEQEVNNKKWYNPPAGAHVVEGFHLFLTGDFLWWKAEEDGLAFTYETNNPSGLSTSNNIKLEEMDFDWGPGYRIGGGFNIPHDFWDLAFYWTHLDIDSKKHEDAESGEGLFPYWSLPDSTAGELFYQNAHAHWKLFSNFADLELGKDYFVGKRMSMRPFLGLRSTWLDQEYHLEYKNASLLGAPVNDFVKMKCSYWGLGPRLGFDMQMWIGNVFSFYGNASISLLYGEFKVKQSEQTQIGPTELEPLTFHDSFHIARPVTDLGIGIALDSVFGEDKLHMSLRGGWEQHVFFDQNQFIRFVSSTTNSLLSNRGDLAFEGWTASLRLDF